MCKSIGKRAQGRSSKKLKKSRRLRQKRHYWKNRCSHIYGIDLCMKEEEKEEKIVHRRTSALLHIFHF